MAEDLLLCFSTSKRGHCISFLVPFSILHCQSAPKHNLNTGLSSPHQEMRGQRSTNISSILHFHCQPQPQRYSNTASAAGPAALAEMPRQSIGGNLTFLHASRILGRLQRNLPYQGSSPFSISIVRGKPATGTYCLQHRSTPS